jgi:hypothetical protein
MSHGVMALVAMAIVAALVVLVVKRQGRRAEPVPAPEGGVNEFLQAPPTSFPAFPSEADRRLLEAVRVDVEAEGQLDHVGGDRETWWLIDDIDGCGEPQIVVDAAGGSLPAFDLTQLDLTGELTVLDLTGDQPVVELPRRIAGREPVMVDLTDSVPAVELAAQLSLSVPGSTNGDVGSTNGVSALAAIIADYDAYIAAGGDAEIDPVVQALIDRVRVKQAVARAGRPAADRRPRTGSGAPQANH